MVETCHALLLANENACARAHVSYIMIQICSRQSISVCASTGGKSWKLFWKQFWFGLWRVSTSHRY